MSVKLMFEGLDELLFSDSAFVHGYFVLGALVLQFVKVLFLLADYFLIHCDLLHGL